MRSKWAAGKARAGRILNGYVTDEQRSRRPISNPTLWAVSSWLFFRVARSLHIDLDMLVARALKKANWATAKLKGLGDGTLVISRGDLRAFKMTPGLLIVSLDPYT
ncbi:MAG: hypothetical protein JO066_08945, partial [Verrucomicrobia bacterium]|nr:hypothetical protein [Verrucomicrobiota bacterium]